MKIAIYGQIVSKENKEYVEYLFSWLANHNVNIIVYADYQKYLNKTFKLHFDYPTFEHYEDIKHDVDCMVSVGGDGTMLNTILLIRDSGIPVMGLNLGRLGFLSNVPKTEMDIALTQLLDRRYSLESRVLLKASAGDIVLGHERVALNDITILKRDTSSMITIHTHLNNEFFTTYWADGLIISTPTGSTGYSLSCGGPIILPSSQSFVITPIAPHNLNMRPVIIPDNSELKFTIESRSSNFLLSLDSRSYAVKKTIDLEIKKASFAVNLVKMPNISYIETLRSKLLWGVDKRN